MEQVIECIGCGKPIAVCKDRYIEVKHRGRKIQIPKASNNGEVAAYVTCEKCKYVTAIVLVKNAET